MKKRQKEVERVYEEQWDGGRGSHHPDFDPEASGDDVVKASRETEELYNALVKVGTQGGGWWVAAAGIAQERRACMAAAGGGRGAHARCPSTVQPRCTSPRLSLLEHHSVFSPPARATPSAQNDIRLVYKKVEEGADVNFVFGRAYKCPEGYTPLMVACHRGRCAPALCLRLGLWGGGGVCVTEAGHRCPQSQVPRACPTLTLHLTRPAHPSPCAAWSARGRCCARAPTPTT